MRIFGADLRELDGASGTATIVALDAQGAVANVVRVDGLPALAREISNLTAGEPFLLAVDVPVALAGTAGKPRRVERSEALGPSCARRATAPVLGDRERAQDRLALGKVACRRG